MVNEPENKTDRNLAAPNGITGETKNDISGIDTATGTVTGGNTDGTTNLANDVEGNVVKLPYPKSIGFIISNEFCERFMYYGMRTILVLYLTRKLKYDDDTATIIFHTFTMLVYFMCTFGAIISDSWLGKFKTILYLSIVYAIGSLIMSLGAMPQLNMPGREITIVGLFLIALGSGGIKPCVASFGGDQFKLPEQLGQMATFFSIFYFSINAGSLISTAITPILREDVNCFGEDDCFSLAFGVPGALMVTSIIIFCIGRFMYIVRAPAGNMVVLVSKCIGNAITTKSKEKHTNKKTHWLDYAEAKYGKQLVNDTKVLLKILLLYIPLPVFWALFDQQGSRWTFQATRMYGYVGSWDIKPDQMQVLNPLLILVFIPLYDVLFYPLLSKVGIRRPLQKLTLGGILAGVAFVLSGIVELQLEKTYPVLPGPGESQLRFFNTHPCDYSFQTNIPNHGSFILKSMETFEEKYIDVNNMQSFTYRISPADSNVNPINCPTFNGNFNLRSEKAMSNFINQSGIVEFEENPSKSSTGDPLMRLLTNTQSLRSVIVRDGKGDVRFDGNTTSIKLLELITSTFKVYIDEIEVIEVTMDQGSVYTVLIVENADNSFTSKIYEIAPANSMHMLWMVPQYVVMTLGEVMYSVTGLAFSYAQAPASMKAVVQACWLLTVAFGNVIDVIIVGAKIFNSQAFEFFLFAGLMFVDMCIFMVLAYRYKSVPPNDEEENLISDETTATGDTKNLTGIDSVEFKKD